jgi:hypothetical protein
MENKDFVLLINLQLVQVNKYFYCLLLLFTEKKGKR